MGILDGAFKRSSEQTLSLRDPALKNLWGSYNTVAGGNITPENSLRISGWYAGIQILAGCVASLPAITYQRLARGKKRAIKHPVYRVLHDQTNSWNTPTEFFETSMAHLIMRGNSFALIERDGAGRVMALWPMAPERMRLQIVEGQRIWYYHRAANGGEQQLRMEDVLHVRGLSSDGILGYSPVDLAREALGLAKAEEEYRARFFKNDARPGAVVEYPGAMSEDAYQRFKSDWQETYGGLGQKFKIGFLEQGLKWHDIGFPPETAQFIEGRKFQLEEIARILRIPLILLQSTEKATSWGTGIEQFMLGFIQFTIREWLKRWERRINISLFTPAEQQEFFAEFLVKDLLRADSITEAQVLQIERRNGVINADDWLEITNRNPLPAKQGQIYVIEANMQSLEALQRQAADETVEGDGQGAANGNGNGGAMRGGLNGSAH